MNHGRSRLEPDISRGGCDEVRTLNLFRADSNQECVTGPGPCGFWQYAGRIRETGRESFAHNKGLSGRIRGNAVSRVNLGSTEVTQITKGRSIYQQHTGIGIAVPLPAQRALERVTSYRQVEGGRTSRKIHVPRTIERDTGQGLSGNPPQHGRSNRGPIPRRAALVTLLRGSEQNLRDGSCTRSK